MGTLKVPISLGRNRYLCVETLNITRVNILAKSASAKKQGRNKPKHEKEKP